MHGVSKILGIQLKLRQPLAIRILARDGIMNTGEIINSFHKYKMLNESKEQQ